MQSVEQNARDLLERMGVEDAQEFSSGDLVELANLLGELYKLKAAQQSRALDLAITCEKCGDLAKYPVCKCGNPIPRPPNQ